MTSKIGGFDDNYRPPEHTRLPGMPRKKLVASVRRTLRLHLQCRPNRDDSLWHATWAWAYQCYMAATSNHWPDADEIATQYVVLALARMKADKRLRLPFEVRSGKVGAPAIGVAAADPKLLTFAE